MQIVISLKKTRPLNLMRNMYSAQAHPHTEKKIHELVPERKANSIRVEGLIEIKNWKLKTIKSAEHTDAW